MHPLVEALVAPAEQGQLRLGGELGRQRVVEPAPARGQGDHAPLGRQLDRVDRVARPQGRLHHVDPDHHAGAAAVGRVVHLARLQRRGGAQVHEREPVTEASALRTWRWSANHSNQPGNRVKTSIFIRAPGTARRPRCAARPASTELTASATSGTSVPSSSSSTEQDGPSSTRATAPSPGPRSPPVRRRATRPRRARASTSSGLPRSGRGSGRCRRAGSAAARRAGAALDAALAPVDRQHRPLRRARARRPPPRSCRPGRVAVRRVPR